MIHEHILAYTFEPIDVVTIIALVFLEGVLSFDNAAVLAALTRKLPPEQRRKALLYGLVGAYVMRVAAILLVAFIIGNPILKVLGGSYLAFLAVKHFVAHAQTKEGKPPSVPRILGLSAFWSIVVYIELTDLAFAIDQVVATVGYVSTQDKILLVVIASIVAILLLRLSAFYMSRLMDWFPQLEHIAYGVVGFVGVKIVAEWAYPDFVHTYMPKTLMVTLTLGAFILPVLWKYLSDRRRRGGSGASAHATGTGGATVARNED